MAGDSDSSGRARRVDFGVVVLLFGAGDASALFLVVTVFTVEPSGCGGRFRDSCSGETYRRLGVGFGLILLVAPVLHKVVPSVPIEQGVGRMTAVAALALGATVGIALTAAAVRAWV